MTKYKHVNVVVSASVVASIVVVVLAVVVVAVVNVMPFNMQINLKLQCIAATCHFS